MKRLLTSLLLTLTILLTACTGSDDGGSSGGSTGNSPGELIPGQPIPETSPFYRGWIKWKLNGQQKAVYRLPVVSNGIRTLSFSGRLDTEDLKIALRVPRTGLGEKTYTDVGALELETENSGIKLKSTSLTLNVTEIGTQVGQYVRGTFKATMTVKQLGTTEPFTVPAETVTEGEFALVLTAIETLAGNYEMGLGATTPLGGFRNTFPVSIIENDGRFYIASDRIPAPTLMSFDEAAFKYEWDWPVMRDGISVGMQRHRVGFIEWGFVGSAAGWTIYTTAQGVQSLQPINEGWVDLTRLPRAS